MNDLFAQDGPLLLVDGSSYLYRAYHALPNLTGPGGVPTGAIHGMVAMLKRAVQDVRPASLACVFDAPGKTFRDDWYPEYKAHRSPMPEPLVQQIRPIHEVVKLLGWPVLMVEGVEADDVIGTLSCLASKERRPVIISTGDKDLAQLVDEHVTLINTMSNEKLDIAGVVEKFGVPPERIVDYLTLMGDAVDNVPGVEKVGPKTAAKWISEFGSLQGVIDAAPNIKGVAGENLRKALAWLPTGKKLVTVKTDCDMKDHIPGFPELRELALKDINREGLLDFYSRFGFKTWKRELEELLYGDAAPATDTMGEVPVVASNVAKSYDTIVTMQALDEWLARIGAAPLTALDTETDSLDPLAARIVGISFSVSPGEAAYIPLRHDYAGAPDQLPFDATLARLKPWLEDADAPKLGQNIKYDEHVFANAGIRVRGYVHDTLLQSYVLEAHKPHSLDSLAQRHLNRKGLSYEDVCGKGANQISFSQVDIARASEYSCEDSEMTLHVHQTLWPQVEAEPGLRRIYEEIEMPVVEVLKKIERNGVLIDPARLAQQSQQLGERMLELEREAHEIAGQPFNMGSPKQIGDILFNKLGLPIIKKTASGAPSTDEEVLDKLAADYPLPAKLLEHRSLSKLKGTYTDKLPLMIDPTTGRVHTNYAQAVAVTGRLSSTDPNLQNIPIRTAEGRRIREAFIASEGCSILSADYSQIELRIMAHISGDENLLKAFAEGMDVHRATAAEVFGVEPEAVTTEQRRYAKTINFGLIYGMGAFGLASNLGIERSAANNYIERYFARYPGVKRYMDDTRLLAREKGYVETLYGRRIYLPEITGGSGPRKAAAERQAINAPMQGTAADLIKLAMLAVQKALESQPRETLMVMQVHDELVFEVPDAELPWASVEIPRLMSEVAQLKVPLLVEVGVGANWDKAH